MGKLSQMKSIPEAKPLHGFKTLSYQKKGMTIIEF
jgi:hypothetical protein